MCLVEGKAQSPVSSPSREPADKTTMTSSSLSARLARTVQDLARPIDPGARVSHVSSQADGSLLLRVQGSADAAERIRLTLKTYYPLATVAVAENMLEGSMSAEILFPSQEEERALALEVASGSGMSKFLSAASLCSAGMALLSFSVLLFASSDAK